MDTKVYEIKLCNDIHLTNAEELTIQRLWQHWVHNTETLATLGTQYTRWRQAKQNNTTQKTKIYYFTEKSYYRNDYQVLTYYVSDTSNIK